MACSSGKAGQFLDLSLKIKSKGSPATVDDDDRKKAVCEDKDDDKDDQNDKDDDNDDDDDDCPIIYDMGGDSEMLLNKGVGVNRTRKLIRYVCAGFVSTLHDRNSVQVEGGTHTLDSISYPQNTAV